VIDPAVRVMPGSASIEAMIHESGLFVVMEMVPVLAEPPPEAKLEERFWSQL
jgi:hypothetical protein